MFANDWRVCLVAVYVAIAIFGSRGNTKGSQRFKKPQLHGN